MMEEAVRRIDEVRLALSTFAATAPDVDDQSRFELLARELSEALEILRTAFASKNATDLR